MSIPYRSSQDTDKKRPLIALSASMAVMSMSLHSSASSVAWIYIDIKDIDVGSYVRIAKRAVAEKFALPQGYNLTWSGQYEYMQRAQKRLMLVIPMTLFIILVIIYVNTRSLIKVMIVFLAVFFPLSVRSGCFTSWGII